MQTSLVTRSLELFLEFDLITGFKSRLSRFNFKVTLVKTSPLLRNLGCKEELMCFSIARINCLLACIPLTP